MVLACKVSGRGDAGGMQDALFHVESGTAQQARNAFDYLRSRVERRGTGGWVTLTDPDGNEVDRAEVARRESGDASSSPAP